MKAKSVAIVFASLIITFPLQAASISQLIKGSVNQKSVTKIDLNKADTKTIAHAIKGIGKKRAEAIINYRTAHGNFKSIEELAKVKSLGKQFVKNHLAELQATFSINSVS